MWLVLQTFGIDGKYFLVVLDLMATFVRNVVAVVRVASRWLVAVVMASHNIVGYGYFVINKER